MIYDCSVGNLPPIPSRVFVDGVEIPLVWYSDDEAGLVKTYAVHEDGKIHLERDRGTWDFLPGVQVTEGGVLFRESRGRVELMQL